MWHHANSEITDCVAQERFPSRQDSLDQNAQKVLMECLKPDGVQNRTLKALWPERLEDAFHQEKVFSIGSSYKVS